MKDVDLTLQNRLERGVYPSGTRQWESDPGGSAYNFAQNMSRMSRQDLEIQMSYTQ